MFGVCVLPYHRYILLYFYEYSGETLLFILLVL